MTTAADTIEQKAAVFDSPDDRRLIAAEAASDPAFARKISKILALPDGERLVADDAKKAIMNELDPSMYPETRGQWPKLRSATARLVIELPRAIDDAVGRMPQDQRAAALSEFANPDGLGRALGLGGLGQFEIIGALVGAFTSVYDTRLQTSTQKQMASMQLQAQEQEIQAQEAEAAAKTAMAKVQLAQALQATLPAPIAAGAQSVISALPTVLQGPASSVVAALSTDVGGGIPLWLPAIGIVLYFKYK